MCVQAPGSWARFYVVPAFTKPKAPRRPQEWVCERGGRWSNSSETPPLRQGDAVSVEELVAERKKAAGRAGSSQTNSGAAFGRQSSGRCRLDLITTQIVNAMPPKTKTPHAGQRNGDRSISYIFASNTTFILMIRACKSPSLSTGANEPVDYYPAFSSG
jgi:hypothetical protein